MIVQDQSEVVSFLEGLSKAGREETHLSEIFLYEDTVLKLKRAVQLPYADFSTPLLRLAACEREYELNSACAPRLYIGVRRITRRDNRSLELDGQGELVDSVVEMRRFCGQGLYERMALEGRLEPGHVDGAADAIAAFHELTPTSASDGAALMSEVLDINERGFAQSGLFPTDEVEAFAATFRSALAVHAQRLSRRSAEGRVRLAHGDLHLRNLCLFEGRPTLFDRLEFNDRIATVDLLYDLAFLAMDLWHCDLPHYANRLVNRYMDRTGDEEDYPLLPFFMAVRSAVRAHVTATQWEEGGKGDRGLAERARGYFDLALDLLRPAEARLVAIGGLSGSGKTTVAEALAHRLGHAPGARILESDRIRKAMRGVAPEAHLPPEAYAPEVSQAVYAAVAKRAALLLAQNAAVVADAVYSDPDHRDAIGAAAVATGVAFTGIWLETQPAILRDRVARRRPGVSDADVSVLEAQLATGASPKDWVHVDASRPAEDIARGIAAM